MQSRKPQPAVSIRRIRAGETIVIAAGQQVPLDGRIQAGSSTLDESWLTGESMPASRSEGEMVYAGTINGTGVLTVEVTEEVQRTTFARVVQLVHRLQHQPARIQRIADRLEAWKASPVKTMLLGLGQPEALRAVAELVL